MIKIDWPRMVFFLSGFLLSVLIAFGFGLYSGWYRTGGYTAGAFIFRSAKAVWQDVVSDPRTADHAFDDAGLILEGAFEDRGFLLLAGYFPAQERAGFRLVRLSDGAVIKEWHPDPEAIRARSRLDDLYPATRFQPSSPVLLEDGGLVFIDEPGPLVRVDSCARIVKVVDDYFHHSIERDLDGNFLVPVKLGELEVLDRLSIVDDGIAVVSLERGVLERISVFQLLERHGYAGLLLGSGPFDPDPVHLNDVKVAGTSSRNWRRGDWLLSLRNRSAVVLYRPSSDQVVWVEHGPWLRQHDPDFLRDGRISVFGNDVIDTPQGARRFYNGSSQLYVFDPADGSVSRPYREVFVRERIGTPSQGRSQITSNGDLFVEETDRGRLLRISREGVLWRYHNSSGGETGVLNWSRYLPALPAPDMLERLRCPSDAR